MFTSSNIWSDDEVALTGIATKEITNNRFRVINVYDEQNGRYIELLTNIMHLSAQTVSRIYKEPWQIELFFKALKQNLKVKGFVGTSENAVHIQIWTTLISILLLEYMQLRPGWSWNSSNLVASMRMVLFQHIDLWMWLDNPFVRSEALPPGESTGNLFEEV